VAVGGGHQVGRKTRVVAGEAVRVLAHGGGFAAAVGGFAALVALRGAAFEPVQQPAEEGGGPGGGTGRANGDGCVDGDGGHDGLLLGLTARGGNACIFGFSLTKLK